MTNVKSKSVNLESPRLTSLFDFTQTSCFFALHASLFPGYRDAWIPQRCTAPTRAARLAGVVQQHGLEMSVSVPSADATGEEDETAAAQRGYKGIVSASKRRRTTKPAGAPRRVVYVVS